MRYLVLWFMAIAIVIGGGAMPRVAVASDDDNWKGVDDTVIEKTLIEAGHPPRKPYINTDQGDLLLFLFLLAGTGGGFIAGYAFRSPVSATHGGQKPCTASLNYSHWTRAPVGSRLARMDVRVKLAIALAAILAVVLSKRFELAAGDAGLLAGPAGGLRGAAANHDLAAGGAIGNGGGHLLVASGDDRQDAAGHPGAWPLPVGR